MDKNLALYNKKPVAKDFSGEHYGHHYIDPFYDGYGSFPEGTPVLCNRCEHAVRMNKKVVGIILWEYGTEFDQVPCGFGRDVKEIKEGTSIDDVYDTLQNYPLKSPQAQSCSDFKEKSI